MYDDQREYGAEITALASSPGAALMSHGYIGRCSKVGLLENGYIADRHERSCCRDEMRQDHDPGRKSAGWSSLCRPSRTDRVEIRSVVEGKL